MYTLSTLPNQKLITIIMHKSGVTTFRTFTSLDNLLKAARAEEWDSFKVVEGVENLTPEEKEKVKEYLV